MFNDGACEFSFDGEWTAGGYKMAKELHELNELEERVISGCGGDGREKRRSCIWIRMRVWMSCRAGKNSRRDGAVARSVKKGKGFTPVITMATEKIEEL